MIQADLNIEESSEEKSPKDELKADPINKSLFSETRPKVKRSKLKASSSSRSKVTPIKTPQTYSIDFTDQNFKTPEELRAFFKALVQQIQSKTRYPRLSKKLRESGLVHVNFRVDQSGRVFAAKLKKPCEYKRLNQSALDVVSRLHLTRLPPKNYPSIEVTFPLSYKL